MCGVVAFDGRNFDTPRDGAYGRTGGLTSIGQRGGEHDRESRGPGQCVQRRLRIRTFAMWRVGIEGMHLESRAPLVTNP